MRAAKGVPALLFIFLCALLCACQKYVVSQAPSSMDLGNVPPANAVSTPEPAAPLNTTVPVSVPETPAPTLPAGDSVYETVYEHLANYELAFVIEDASEDEVIDAYNRVIQEHPELFWLGGAYEYTTYTDGGLSEVRFDTLVEEEPSVLEEKLAQLLEEADRVLSGIDAQLSDYEKALAVHDILVLSTDYDREGLAYLHTLEDDSVRDLEDCETAYGCLINKSAVCSGYARAYQLLMQKLGVECGRVNGNGKGEDHEWNYIRLDGEYYFVDVTWDDPVMEDPDAARYPCSHVFFGMTTEELEKTHTFDEDQFIPVCTATHYRYYPHEGLFLSEYTYDSAAERIASAVSDGEIELMFGSMHECEAALLELCDSAAIGNVPGIGDASRCAFYKDPDYPVLQITF